jgi:hypothetical protein
MPPEHAPLIGHGHETHLFSGLESILSLCKVSVECQLVNGSLQAITMSNDATQ